MNFQYFKCSRSTGLLRTQCSLRTELVVSIHNEGQRRQKPKESSRGWSEYVQNYLSSFKITLNHKISSFNPCLLWPYHSGSLHRTMIFLLNFNLCFSPSFISTLKHSHCLFSYIVKHIFNCNMPQHRTKTYCMCLSMANSFCFIPYSRCFPCMPFTLKTDKEAEGERATPRGRASLVIGKQTWFLDTVLVVWQDGVNTTQLPKTYWIDTQISHSIFS